MIGATRRPGFGSLLLSAGVAAAVVVLALLAPSQPSLVFGAAAIVLAASFAMCAPAVLFAAAFATVFAYWRVGPASMNMSTGDAVTIVALFAAIPFVPWRSRQLRQVLFGIVVYLGLLLVVVAATPTSRAAAEWGHRGLLFAGAILIGAAVAAVGQTRNALRAIVFAAAFVSVAAIVYSVTHGFDAAYPFNMHKNAIGPILAMVVVLLIAAPWRTELRPSTVRHLRLLIILGTISTQSRGSLLALVAVVAIYAMRHRRARQRAPLFFLVVALALILVSAVTLQSDSVNNPKFNGVELRTVTIDAAIDRAWRPHPFAGAGLKYFQSGFSTVGGAEQIFVAELAEAGLVGLAALLILIANTLRVLIPRRDPIGEAALLTFVLLLLYSQTAIFWIAGTLTFPMLVVGLAVGTEGSRTALPESRSISGLNR